MILYATLAQGPKLPPADQINSTRHCDFAGLAPPPPPVLPDWSPVKAYGGYHQAGQQAVGSTQAHARAHASHGLWHRLLGSVRRGRPEPLWGALGCECFAF